MPDTLEKYVGEYEVNTDYKVKITCITNQLFIQRNKGAAIKIFAYKENNFFQKDDDIRYLFKAKKTPSIR